METARPATAPRRPADARRRAAQRLAHTRTLPHGVHAANGVDRKLLHGDRALVPAASGMVRLVSVVVRWHTAQRRLSTGPARLRRGPGAAALLDHATRLPLPHRVGVLSRTGNTHAALLRSKSVQSLGVPRGDHLLAGFLDLRTCPRHSSRQRQPVRRAPLRDSESIWRRPAYRRDTTDAAGDSTVLPGGRTR